MNEIEKKEENKIDILEAFVAVAPYLNKLMHDDMSISIYDTERLRLAIPAETFSLNLTPGEPLVEGDILATAIRNNKEIAGIVPKELFGVLFSSKVVPVYDHSGKVVGGVGVGTSLEKASQLHEVAEGLSAIVNQTATSIEQITGSVSTLANRVADISTHMAEVSTGADHIGKISTVVKGVSDQSNLLGLNAAIEAARAGEAGRGFSVVADEIRKLAINSKENVTQIDEITKSMQKAIQNLNTAFSGINEFTENQAAAIQEISATVQKISQSAQHLSEMAAYKIQSNN